MKMRWHEERERDKENSSVALWPQTKKNSKACFGFCPMPMSMLTAIIQLAYFILVDKMQSQQSAVGALVLCLWSNDDFMSPRKI